jgi:hypothetical protein
VTPARSAKRRRRTPIERYIEEGTIDRRTQWEINQNARGLTRITVRVHRDDMKMVKAYCASLLKAREPLVD